MKKETISIIRELAGNEFLYLETSLVVKLSPHSWPVLIWAVCVSPKDEIFLMDKSSQWFPLEKQDINYERVLASLYQRVRTIKRKWESEARRLTQM